MPSASLRLVSGSRDLGLASSAHNTPPECSGPLGWTTRAETHLAMAKPSHRRVRTWKQYHRQDVLWWWWETMLSVSVTQDCAVRHVLATVAPCTSSWALLRTFLAPAPERAGRDRGMYCTGTKHTGTGKSASWGKIPKIV